MLLSLKAYSSQKNRIYEKDELWEPEVKIHDEITHRSKVFEIIGKDGQMISFGYILF